MVKVTTQIIKNFEVDAKFANKLVSMCNQRCQVSTDY